MQRGAIVRWNAGAKVGVIDPDWNANFHLWFLDYDTEGSLRHDIDGGADPTGRRVEYEVDPNDPGHAMHVHDVPP